MVRHYSHEAADLQPALEMLREQNMEDHGVCVYSCMQLISVGCSLCKLSHANLTNQNPKIYGASLVKFTHDNLHG